MHDPKAGTGPRVERRWPLLSIALVALGCSGSGSYGSWTNEETGTVTGLPEAALLRGQLTLESQRTLGGAAPSSITAALRLVDTTQGYRVSRTTEGMAFPPACFGLTGAVQETCRPGFSKPCPQQPLDVDRAELSSPTAAVALKRNSAGNYGAEAVPEAIFNGELTAKVTGKADKGFFPTYQQTLSPPDAMELEVPDFKTPPQVGGADFKLQWIPGNGDHVEITVRVKDSPITDKVVCLVQDDGRHAINAGAFEWFRNGDPPLKAQDIFLVTVKRVRAKVDAVDAKTSVQLKSSSQVEFAVAQ